MVIRSKEPMAHSLWHEIGERIKDKPML